MLFVASVLAEIVNMAGDRSDTKKIKKPKHPPQTVCDRTAIGANWQALQSSNMLNGCAPKQEKTGEKYAGVFRRNHKKNKNNQKSRNNTQSVANTQAVTKLVEQKVDETNICNEEALAAKTDERRGKPTPIIAMDCEMVGVGIDGRENMLARVSIVNRFGDCIYDKFVKPREEVTNYRTKISGIRKEDMISGEEFSVVQHEVAELLRGKTLVGHSLNHDLAVLYLSHSKRQIRDTAKYKPFRKLTRGNTPSLKQLASELLGADIQGGEHSSVEDARAVMQIYARVAKDWEHSLRGRRKQNKAASTLGDM